jgi:tetratricopeptide (TPR) repeat protein
MSSLNDARGLPTSGVDQTQLDRYEAILVDLYLYRPGVQKRLDALIEEAPGFVMGHVLRGYSIMTDGLRSGLAEASRFLTQAQHLSEGATARERLHIAVLQAWINGRVSERFHALEEILVRWPLDLLAYRQLTGALFWTGDKARQLAAAMQALPSWTPSIQGYHLVLGPLAFALEEAGRYDLAESYARQALADHPTDLWALHALAHVHEMRGESRAGDQMISAVAHQLNDFNLFRGHLWWHLALFRLAQVRYDEVLELFDRQIFPQPSAFYLDLQNAASLLARLEIQGVHVGDRWERVALAVEQTRGQHLVVFTAPHEVMALARTQRQSSLELTLAGWRDDAQADMAQAATGSAVSQAVALYYQGAYLPFLDSMRQLRYQAPSLGASHAQNDIYFQFMVDAALQLEDVALAKGLLKERLSQRVTDAPGWQRYAAMVQQLNATNEAQTLRGMLRQGLVDAKPNMRMN